MTLATISSTTPRLTVKCATTSAEIEQALRLRYRVFVEEANNSRLWNEHGLEFDVFDQWCDHLLVIDQNSDQVVGTYRLLPGERALAHQGFYSQTEFDLSRFAHLPNALELGRSCIAADYRGTRAIQMLWGGIANYLAERPHSHLIGCASMNHDELPDVSALYSMLRQHAVITERYAVQPLATHRMADLRCLPITCSEREMVRRLPPLIKGYRWMGAELAGEPAYDPLFHTTDFFVVFETSQMTKRYQRHFASSYQATA